MTGCTDGVVAIPMIIFPSSSHLFGAFGSCSSSCSYSHLYTFRGVFNYLALSAIEDAK